MATTPPTDLDEARRIQLGNAAKQLAENDLFKLVASRVIQGAQLAGTNSLPDQTSEREQLYWLQRGVKAFIDELGVMSNDATILEKKATKVKAAADGDLA